ncbi:MAG: acyl-CoA thioesterase domain-containing protein, partial [Polyangiales bacterium]
MSVPFRVATAVARLSDDEFEADIPDKWQQGPGAFGGLTFGILLRAARAFEPDLTRVARTFACDIAGPVLVGKATVRVQALRRGRSQTNLRIELTQGGNVLASALCTMSGARTNTAPAIAPEVP